MILRPCLIWHHTARSLERPFKAPQSYVQTRTAQSDTGVPLGFPTAQRGADSSLNRTCLYRVGVFYLMCLPLRGTGSGHQRSWAGGRPWIRLPKHARLYLEKSTEMPLVLKLSVSAPKHNLSSSPQGNTREIRTF
jgi:hypothetical protein